MNTTTAAELAAWLEDAVDPDRAEEIGRLAAATPTPAARVEALRARLCEAAEVPTPGWLLPLPGLRLPGAPLVQLSPALVMGTLSPGSRFEVRIEDPPNPFAARLIVLTRGEGDWEVVFPADPDEDIAVAELPTAKGGGRLVGLVVGPTPGAQRWALIYVDRSVVVEWASPPELRWAPLQLALEQGIASATVVEKAVAPRR